ncbi:WXG100 family type VII secretion target [Saccharothrix sp. Mg75]|uniref:WXG100 family type VII secretion target n=1 Tax=Saccharothrix sp. Mg75 TaxID=3445357 RepID=UPI003EEBF6C9
MNAPISTTTPGMLRAAGYFENTQAVAQQGVQSVDDVLNLMRASWSGEAFLAYRGSMTAWFDDCKVIITSLGEMINLVHNQSVVTTRGEDGNTQIAASMPMGASQTAGLGI